MQFGIEFRSNYHLQVLDIKLVGLSPVRNSKKKQPCANRHVVCIGWLEHSKTNLFKVNSNMTKSIGLKRNNGKGKKRTAVGAVAATAPAAAVAAAAAAAAAAATTENIFDSPDSEEEEEEDEEPERKRSLRSLAMRSNLGILFIILLVSAL
jgi:hypothetical protein